MKTNHEDKTLTCNQCEGKFTRSSYLDAHISNKHFDAHGTHVPDKNLEGRKLEIFFSCLFDKIPFLNYASFCLSYQDGLNDIGKKIVKLAVYPAHVIRARKLCFFLLINC